MCAFPCGYVHMSTKEARGVRSPGVGVAVMRHPMWVLEMEFESLEDEHVLLTTETQAGIFLLEAIGGYLVREWRIIFSF